MKVLIAEDDDSCARLLKFVFQKAGYEVEVAKDGNEAWAKLQKKDSPKLAVLDWMMPGLSGVDVCAKVRSSGEEIRTYVMLLTAKTHSRDIVDALDAGADDYVTKPFDSRELLARLRVAERTITLQNHLHRQIHSLEALLRRHNLLGELYHSRSPATSDDDPKGLEINHIFAKTLEDMGLSLDSQAPTESDPVSEPYWVVWTALLLRSSSQWYDIRLQTDAKSAETLYRQIVGNEPANKQAIADLLAEILSLAQNNMARRFMSKEEDVLTPFISRTFRSESLRKLDLSQYEAATHGFKVGDAHIELAVAEHSAGVSQISLRKLQVLDVVTDPIFRPFPKHQILINAGVAINSYHLQKMAGFKLLWMENQEVAVIESTPLARALHGIDPDDAHAPAADSAAA